MKTPNTYALLDALSKSMSPAAIKLAGLQGVIAAEICKKRFDLHMNQKEFADYMGVSQSTVSKWEKGETNFTLNTLSQIADKLQIPMQCPFVTTAPPHYNQGQIIHFDDYKTTEWRAESSDVAEFKTLDDTDELMQM